MIELIMIFYIIPKRIYPVARMTGRSGLGWSVIAGGAFLATEMLVGFTVAMIYTIVSVVTGIPFEINGGLQLLLYIPSLIGGFVCLGLVQKYLTRRATPALVPPPPAPPKFDAERNGYDVGDRKASNTAKI